MFFFGVFDSDVTKDSDCSVFGFFDVSFDDTNSTDLNEAFFYALFSEKAYTDATLSLVTSKLTSFS